MLLKWFCKIKLIVHSHNIESLRFKSTGKWWWSILWKYEKITCNLADYVFFITDEDRDYGVKKLGVKESRCTTVTYGIEIDKAPALTERNAARKELERLYNIKGSEIILLFNGTLNYTPNLNALKFILDELNVAMLKTNTACKIIVCGKGLPAEMNDLKNY